VAATERDALFQVLDALETLQIPYMVVGSFASTFWGRPRLTHDADLVVEITGEQVSELARLLAPNFYAPLFVVGAGLSRARHDQGVAVAGGNAVVGGVRRELTVGH
jgi:hypothetical protein